jgi:hypothetical protein
MEAPRELAAGNDFKLQRSALRLNKALFGIAATVLVASSHSPPVYAYRPFDGTDAAVADVGELEFELQPAGMLQEGASQTLVAPWLVTNFGFAKNWEAVLEGKLQTPLSFNDPPSLTDAGLFLKQVLREGSLQNKPGPSIATEFGVLLPGINEDSGTGATWAGIVSERWEWGTVHFNLQPSLTRDEHGELFVSTILEGPSKWKVRPVAEIFFDDKFGTEREASVLVGLIWQARDNLAFDFAVPAAEKNGHPEEEIRAGLTFGIPLWHAK